ncbi:MAG: hypothetical protein HFE81_06315 [Bacilli bacterium]|nr:hypothetical protein [Bacilli bacterium]
MEVKITGEELNNLVNIMQEKNILQEWILKLCKIRSLIELNVIQYNYLLMIIKVTEIGGKEC